MNSRRKFLRSAASTGFSAATLAAFPLSIRRALATPANNTTGTIMDVKHVVILTQENRGFDHYFGMLQGVRGFGDRLPMPLTASLPIWQQRDKDGNLILPYHLDMTKGNAIHADQTPHVWDNCQAAWDGGRMSKWVVNKSNQASTMGYYEQAEVPFQYALANAFTLCDAYHCSMHAGTNSNRMFIWSGTNGPSGQTANGVAGVASVSNVWEGLGPSSAANAPDWKTYPERLQDATPKKIGWMVYQNLPDNFTDNSLAGFKNYRKANEDSGKPANAAYDRASDEINTPLYKGISNTMPDGGRLQSFKDDITNGTLPEVSWIVAPASLSEHPGPSDTAQGGSYVQQVLDALTAVPEVWSQTVLFVNYDENDGRFDHMPSPCAPSLDGNKKPAGKTTLSDTDMSYEYYTHKSICSDFPNSDGRVYGPGMRVPMLVISPWSVGGWVNSQVFDHTSVLRFLEARFGVKETNISPFRRAVCGDLTSAFDFKTPNADKRLGAPGRMTPDAALALRNAQDALKMQVPLPATPQMPQQATGTRPSRALPYELHVSARSDVIGGKVQLLFDNTGTAAAVFHVYDKLHLDRLPRRYMVEAGKALDDTWNAMTDDNGAYDLWVLGPNGFHRHFKGNLSSLRAGNVPVPEIQVCYDIANGNVYLKMFNGGKKDCTFTIRAKAYRNDGPWTAIVAGGNTVERHWELAASYQWYDFEVTCDTDAGYYRRFAGRVETGKHSVSDPAMGLADL